MKAYIKGMSLLDALTVAHDADPTDLEQAAEFGIVGGLDYLAATLFATAGPRWAVADANSHMQIAVGGFFPLRKGVYQSWFLSREGAFQSYGRDLTSICRRSMQHMMDSGANRLETVSLSNRALAHRWYESLGMTREADHPYYGVTGQSATTYVRIR